MKQKTIGEFIASCRKEKGLTQEELALKLNVTSKTISRWETNITMPDLSLLKSISECFDISDSELLNGRKMNRKELLELKETIDNLLNYGVKENKTKINKIFLITKISIILSSLLAILTCIICDLVVNRCLSWSLIVIISIILGDILILPLLNQNKKIIKSFLSFLSISIVPYLLLLSMILKNKLIFTLGTSISIISLIIIWIIYYLGKSLIFKRKYLFLGITFILLTILKISIHLLTHIFIENIKLFNISLIIETSIILTASIICLIINYNKTEKQ